MAELSFRFAVREDTPLILSFIRALAAYEQMADQVIAISKSFNIDAQIVGHIEEGQKSLTIKSEFGEFNY